MLSFSPKHFELLHREIISLIRFIYGQHADVGAMIAAAIISFTYLNLKKNRKFVHPTVILAKSL